VVLPAGGRRIRSRLSYAEADGARQSRPFVPRGGKPADRAEDIDEGVGVCMRRRGSRARVRVVREVFGCEREGAARVEGRSGIRAIRVTVLAATAQ
jgi:hypothetical protein